MRGGVMSGSTSLITKVRLAKLPIRAGGHGGPPLRGGFVSLGANANIEPR